MDKFFIEERDARLLLKVADVRGSLSKRHHRYTSRRKRPWLIVPLLLALVICLGYLIYNPDMMEIHNIFPSSSDSVQETAAEPEPAAVSEADSPSPAPAEEPIADIQPPDANDIPATMASLPEQLNPPESTTVPNQSEPEISVAAEQPAPEPKQSENRLTINRFSVGKGVQDREIIGETSSFFIENDPRAYIWMEVSAKDIPCGLTHTFYHNGIKYCEVPLAIQHPRMRTWSFITLRGPDFIGSWQVEIADDKGGILKRIEFNVLP